MHSFARSLVREYARDNAFNGAHSGEKHMSKHHEWSHSIEGPQRARLRHLQTWGIPRLGMLVNSEPGPSAKHSKTPRGPHPLQDQGA